ncbi:MAG: response regulator, partial [Candidatus Methanosuratus sp.]|nr:response regulator [Candidatus Methanosuratincola sp.]
MLIVDDEPDIRTLLGRIVRECGFSVAEAGNGEEALAQLARLEVSLILCNVRMRGLSGPAFYSVLEQVAPDLSQRVVFCTGDVACADTLKFLRGTGRRVIIKPFEIDEVYQVLESYAGSPVHVSTKVSL